MKNYVFVVEDLYGGGAEKVLLSTAKLLLDAGHGVHVLTLRDKIEHEIPVGLNPINIGCVNKVTKMFDNILFEKFQASVILKKINKLNPDVVVSCSCDKITRHLHKELNIYYWIHGNITNFSKNIKKSYKKARRFYSNKKIICVSQGIAYDLINCVGVNAESVQVIYNPFDENDIIKKSNLYQPDVSGKYFISLGSFEKRKRHDRLLRAYKMSGVNTPLILMGKGGEEKEIIGMINDLDLTERVVIKNFEKNPYPYIKNAAALVLTSDAEGLPTVLIESLICRTPVISVDCPSGPSEILVDDLKEYLCPLEDEEKLAMLIKKIDSESVVIESKHFNRFLSKNCLGLFESL
ncbi:glycosyltransferase [Zobellella aerophila]|uniref:Glycosyltransferase n=1 Tax=Zobellella aerophila TaxID=870480 RepID=A0ABP6W1N2_9GAMM